jgi:TP53 regulating kinase-like protein
VRGEVKSLLKARKLGVSTPALYHVDVDASTIIMEHINGKSVKAMLREDVLEDATATLLMHAIAEQIVKLHDGGLVHGDLTTSNMLVVMDPGNIVKIIIIDFGLSYNSTFPEDKAVDLYVLERAFASAHAEKGAQYFEAFMDAYKKKSRFWSSTFNRFAEVRMRGRKRAMIG